MLGPLPEQKKTIFRDILTFLVILNQNFGERGATLWSGTPLLEPKNLTEGSLTPTRAENEVFCR